MAKGRGKQSRGGPAPSSASVSRWETTEDIPTDAQEDFHHDRDRVLLNGTKADDDETDFGELATTANGDISPLCL